jgi:hypothetical protein
VIATAGGEAIGSFDLRGGRVFGTGWGQVVSARVSVRRERSCVIRGEGATMGIGWLCSGVVKFVMGLLFFC